MDKAKRKEVFKTVKTHMLKQKVKSVLGGIDRGCAYRGENGLTCAVGCLIKDEHYDHVLEECNSEHKAVIRAVENSLDVSLRERDILMLSCLQSIHDDEPEGNWHQELDDLEDSLFT